MLEERIKRGGKRIASPPKAKTSVCCPPDSSNVLAQT